MIRAVLFDIDGTLLDHDSASRHALASISASLSSDPDPAEAGRIWLELEELHYNAYLEGAYDLDEARRRRARGFVNHFDGRHLGDEEASEWYERYLEGYREGWRLFDDVEPLLEELGGIDPALKLGAVTNADGPYQRVKVRAVGLDVLLGHFTASSEAPAAKPDPRIFEHACAQAELPPEQVAYVGDRHDVDAEGAHAAGLRAVWLDRPGSALAVERSEPVLPEGIARISGLGELTAVLDLA